MERTISSEERIRRAEEIYNRRRVASGSGVRVSSSSVNSSKNKLSLFKKMGLQLAICSVIYIIFYLIKNTNYIFSEDVIKKTKELLSYDINFGNVYAQVTSFIEENKDKFNFLGTIENNEVQENDIQGNEIENNQTEENKEAPKNQEEKSNNETTNKVSSGGIGGAETNEVQEANETKKKTQMDLDAEYIKKNYSFKVPLEGTVTSRYGAREATEIVSANHYGIDIGGEVGTAIYAAMEGTVTLVSSEGDYGKHIEITNGKIMTRYAHCSKITVKQGAKIKQGQKIAEVGETRTCNRTTSTF